MEKMVSLGGPIRLRLGMPVAQVTIHRLSRPALDPYRGRYNGDERPTPARVMP